MCRKLFTLASFLSLFILHPAVAGWVIFRNASYAGANIKIGDSQVHYVPSQDAFTVVIHSDTTLSVMRGASLKRGQVYRPDAIINLSQNTHFMCVIWEENGTFVLQPNCS